MGKYNVFDSNTLQVKALSFNVFKQASQTKPFTRYRYATDSNNYIVVVIKLCVKNYFSSWIHYEPAVNSSQRQWMWVGQTDPAYHYSDYRCYKYHPILYCVRIEGISVSMHSDWLKRKMKSATGRSCNREIYFWLNNTFIWYLSITIKHYDFFYCSLCMFLTATSPMLSATSPTIYFMDSCLLS